MKKKRKPRKKPDLLAAQAIRAFDRLARQTKPFRRVPLHGPKQTEHADLVGLLRGHAELMQAKEVRPEIRTVLKVASDLMTRAADALEGK